MIQVASMAWTAAGLVVGLLHADMLRRASRRLTAWSPALGMFRLGIVSALLILAALSGFILAAAVGWASGFFLTTCFWMAMRWRLQSVGTPLGPSE